MLNNSSPPNLDNSSELLARLFNQYKRNNRVIISISVAGIIIFLLVALAFPFRDKIFNRLYPKPGSQASACSGNTQVPANRGGFVFTGGDLEQAVSSLQTSLYDAYDFNLGPKKSFYILGRYAQNQSDPLGMRLLMEDNLSNVDFKGLRGQNPAGWNVAAGEDGSATIDVESKNAAGGGTSLKLSSNKSNLSQVSQVFKKKVLQGQFVIFGGWVKTASQTDVNFSIQNSESPFGEFGVADTSKIEPNKWTYVTGYGKVPEGITNFHLVLQVKGVGKTAWYNGVEAAVVSPDQNQAIAKLVLQRCGSVWMIDDAPGWEQSSSSPFMKPLSSDAYALIYNAFYTLIKSSDPSAKVLPGGLMGAPVVFDGSSGYSPQSFLESFRASYKSFFDSEPPVDALGIRYLATDQNRWSGSEDFENYLTKLRGYMDKVVEWKDKPIWITRLGVSRNAPNGGVDFLQAATKFLVNNNLNIEKWFWYDTCGYNSQMAPLFESSNKICSWPMKLTALGQAYVTANATPTPAPTQSSTPTSLPNLAGSTSTPSASVAPTPISTDSGKLQEGTPSGTNP
ncbi:carbohydrate binding domain-containing protein [Candidatus Daviesbacteria bacterium]|nr:carbohydrate binding domain-containing protein [Candidatus Daviesbacteria bacterium]